MSDQSLALQNPTGGKPVLGLIMHGHSGTPIIVVLWYGLFWSRWCGPRFPLTTFQAYVSPMRGIGGPEYRTRSSEKHEDSITKLGHPRISRMIDSRVGRPSVGLPKPRMSHSRATRWPKLRHGSVMCVAESLGLDSETPIPYPKEHDLKRS